ncbi:MAG TPA: flagellar biosynthetic protein FliR [Acidisoma sp.]|uniref:flagellar biosynthetic protein FliR n=1 Tax=Acidisoma sp. TaxID=1872115 RepID=UPI002C920437|nr:flagellar biosynthetic protein FliR [Acidisoma sp.]HTI00496.1 flagellar biosynthetic protein FliR [Acidisoma sp.]
MVLSEHQVLAWLGAFLWPFLRLTGLFLTAPLYSSALIPAQVKAALVLALSACLAFWLPNLPPFPGYPAAAIYQGVIQIAIGGAIGMVAQIIVSAVAAVGEIAGLSIGLSFAVLQFREAQGQTQALYDLMLWLGLIGYTVLGGPVWLFAALAHSFQGGVAGLDFNSWAQLADFGGVVIATGVTLAAPVLAVALCVNLTVGLMTVFAPQLNLLTIGFPTLILAGLATLAGSLVVFGGAMQHLSELAARTLAAMLSHG